MNFKLLSNFRESFNYSYQEPNPTPREYLLNPVGETVIYIKNMMIHYMISLLKKQKKYLNNIRKIKNEILIIYDEHKNQIIKKCYSFHEIPHAMGDKNAIQKLKNGAIFADHIIAILAIILIHIKINVVQIYTLKEMKKIIIIS